MQHVLLIEDTWTSGGNAQSAALALRRAGAASVTILALARWLNPEEPPTSTFVARYLGVITNRLRARWTSTCVRQFDQ